MLSTQISDTSTSDGDNRETPLGFRQTLNNARSIEFSVIFNVLIVELFNGVQSGVLADTSPLMLNVHNEFGVISIQ